MRRAILYLLRVILTCSLALCIYSQHKVGVDATLQPDVDYMMGRCKAIGLEQFCKDSMENVTRVQIEPHCSLYFGFMPTCLRVIGVTYYNIFGNSLIYISNFTLQSDDTRRSTVIHELGHGAFGLGHTPQWPPDMMSPVSEPIINSFSMDYYTDVMLKRAYAQTQSALP